MRFGVSASDLPSQVGFGPLALLSGFRAQLLRWAVWALPMACFTTREPAFSSRHNHPSVGPGLCRCGCLKVGFRAALLYQ